MALTGVLRADFTEFLTAVSAAETKLVSFQTGASKVEQSLNTMVNSFAGTKIISQATLATEAVERIGGASKLTAAEQARVNATVTEAIAKYTALGQQAPAKMLALAEATKRVEAPTEGLSTKMVALGSFIGTMAANALAALTRLAIDGVKRVVSELGELITSGSKLAGIENSFQTLAASMGETAAVMLGAMRTGTRGLVSDMDLMQAANKAILLGLPVTSKEMGDLAQTASILGRAMGLTATQSFNDLIVALGRSSPMILDNLGLSVKVGEANEVMAASIGKTAEQLTDAEKKTAFYNAAMEAARAKVAALGEAHLTLGDNIQQAGVWWTNFKNDLAITIAKSPVVAAATDAIGKSLGEAFGSSQEARVSAMNTGVSRLAIFLADAASIGVSTAKYIAQGFLLLRGVLFGVLESVGNIITTFLQGNARIAEFAASIPILGKAWTGVAADARFAADAMGSVTASFKATGDGAFESMGKVGASMDGANAKIAGMRAAMEAAATATGEQTVQVAKLAAAETAAAKPTAEMIALLTRKAAVLAELRAENVALDISMSGTRREARIADIEAEFQKEVDTLTRKKELTAEILDALERQRDLKVQKELADYDRLNAMSRSSLADRAAYELATLEAMQARHGEFSTAQIAIQRETWLQAKDAMLDWRSAGEEALDSTTKNVQATGSAWEIAFARMSESVSDTIGRTKELNAEIARTFSMDIQPLTNTQLSNLGAGLNPARELLNPGSGELSIWTKLRDLERLENTYAPKSAEEYFAMLNDQVLLSQLRMWAEGQERPPGFAGGVENFAGGLAYVHKNEMLVNLPSGTSVIPAGRGGGTTVNITINGSVLGNKDEIARVVGDAVMQSMRGQGFRAPGRA